MEFVKLRHPVRDLGAEDARLAGILSPGYSQAEVNRHIHALFQEKYQEYMKPFPLTREGIDHWKEMIRALLPASHADVNAPFTILDLGSGEGTSVFPLLEVFPNAEVIASDLSTNLLRELRRWHGEHCPARRLHVLQQNVEAMVFEDSQIDIVTGAQVLHHLANVRQAFMEIHRILKPGGIAVFWDGFEIGCQIVSLVLQLLAARNETVPSAERIPSPVIAGFLEFTDGIVRRRGGRKDESQLEAMDDKWIFTETQLRTALSGTGLKLTEIRPTHSSGHGLISLMVNHELRRRLLDLQMLPAWARALVDDVERQFSDELKSEILYGGVIMLTRPGTDERLAMA